jgi:hypothetical protein
LGRPKKWRATEKCRKDLDVFITGDRNLIFQQKPASFDIAIVVLHAESIQLPYTQPLMVKVLETLPTITPGQIVQVHP